MISFLEFGVLEGTQKLGNFLSLPFAILDTDASPASSMTNDKFYYMN